MADRTLRYGQSPEEAMGIGLRPRPNDPWSAAAAGGLGGLSPSIADSLIQKMPNTLIGDFDYSAPDMKPTPSGGDDILFDSTSGLMSVNGFEFQSDDYADAVKSKQYLGQGGAPRKPGAWAPLSQAQYSEYLGRIEDPTLGTRFKRSFEIGTQGLKTLGGAALQFAGAEELGSGIVNRAAVRQEELSPFQARAADVASGEISAIEYAVSMIGQQGPNIIETIGVGLAGFATGTVASANPLGGALAGVGAMFTKAGFKKLAKEAAEQYAKGGAKSLSASQRKALAQLGGAGAATAMNNYAIGTADVYNEQRERGAEPDDASARAMAAALGIPYAILSTIPEAIGAGKLFGLGVGGGLAKRLAKGVAVGGVLEGATEAGQELLAMGAGSQYEKYDDDEVLSRVIESAVAGFTVGGTIGGVVNLRRGQTADLLTSNPTQQEVEPEPSAEPTQLEMDLQGGSLKRGRTRQSNIDSLGSGAALRTNYQGEQGEMFGSDIDLGQTPFETDVPLGQTPFNASPAQQQFNFGTPPTSPVQGPLEGQLDLPLEGGQMRSDTLALPSPTSIPGQVVTPPPPLITPAPAAPVVQTTANPVTGQEEMFTPTEMGLPTATQARVTGQELPFTGNVLRPTIQVDTTQADLEAQGQQRFTESFVAPPPPPPVTTAMADGLNPLRQAMRQSQEDQRQAVVIRTQKDADFDAAEQQVSDAAFDATLTVDEYVDATTQWDTFNDSRKKLSSPVTLDSRKMNAQREWVQAVRDNTADKALFDKLRKTKAQPNGQREPLIRNPNEPDGTPTPTPTSGKKKLSVKKTAKETVKKPKPSLKKKEPPTKKPKAQVKPEPKVEVEPEVEPVAETETGVEVAVQEDLTAGRDAYAAYRDGLKEPTSVATFDNLSLSDQQNINTKAIKGTVKDSDLATIALNSPVGVALEPEETTFRDSSISDMIDAVETETGAKYKQNLYALTRAAYFAPTQGKGIQRRDEARKYLEDFVWDQDSRVILLTVAQEVETINVMDSKGVNPAFSLVRTQGLIPSLKDTGVEFDTATKGKKLATPANIKEELEGTASNANTSIMEFVDKIKEKPAGQNRASGRFSLDGAVDDNGSPIRTMANGRVRMLARQFISKLESKPKLFVYRSQADLKARNPKLYKEAAAARTEGDFENTSAVGYAFNGDTVLIFSENIANAQHLNFVMAHEVLGHYGLRSIVPKAQFDSLMESIYDTDTQVQSAVDSNMEVYGQSKAEAVEEYIADYAAVVDTSVMARVVKAIKKFLNKLGVKFGDEDVRYLVDQSRKYVRKSATGNGKLVIMQEVAQQYRDVTTNTGTTSTGRFAPATDMRTANIIQARVMGQGNPITNWEDIWSNVTDKGRLKDVKDGLDRFSSKYLSLSNYRARKNAGLKEAHNLFMRHGEIASEVRIKANDVMRMALDRTVLGLGSITEKQTAKVNEMLYDGQRKGIDLSEGKGLGKMALFRVGQGGQLEVQETELKALVAMGTRSFEELRDGYTYEDKYVDKNNEAQTQTEVVKGIAGLTETSIEYVAYKQVREAMVSTELSLLKAKYKAYLQEKANSAANMGDLLKDGETLTTKDKSVIRGLIDYMGVLYTENTVVDAKGMRTPDSDAMQNAEDFVQDVNKYLIGATKDKGVKVQSYYKDGKGVAITEQLDSIRGRMVFEAGNKYLLQEEIRRVMLSDYLNRESDVYTKRSIATGYIPILREGRYQIRVQAMMNGKPVQLLDSHQELLVYKQVQKASEAERLAKLFNTDMGNETTFKAMVKDPNTGEFTTQSVTLEAVSESVLDSVSGPPQLNLNDFVRGIQFFNINLPPEKMARVVTGLTKQNASARQRLERSFTPGGDLDGILAASQHIDRRASSIAKTELAPVLTNLMNLNLKSSRAKWYMNDPETKARLKRFEDSASDPRLSQEQRADAQREYSELKSMVDNTQRGGTNYGNEYHAEAAKGVDFLNSNRDVSMSDFEATKLASGVRSYASLFQLGGSIATGTLNFIGVYVNGLPYLASHNKNTNFGGGFGFASMGAINKAMSDVGLRGITGNLFPKLLKTEGSGLKFDTADFYDSVAASSKLQEQHNLNKFEAEFLAREIRQGVMIPAQSNAMMGLSRGNMSKAWMQKFTDGFMYPFNATERGARRGFGLASYRLEFARLKGAGKTDAEANTGATKFSVEAINNTMGEYSVLNRPSGFRSGLMSFVYMYKVYPVTSIQMFSNLSRAGKVGMLTSLILLSGMSGVPLAEDLEDLIDTLAQALGFKSGSIRFEAAKLLEDLYPGSSKALLDGVLGQIMPIDVGGRVSLGNVIPGTAMFLSGSDKYREIKDIFGPSYGFLEQAGEFAFLAASAPFSSTVSASDVLRKAPATTVRNVGDVFAYLKNGTVVDKRGYTVTEDMSFPLILGRLAGFYPKEAANQYGAIKYAKRVTDYQRNVTTEFKRAWLKGSRNQRRAIELAVRDWNKTARGTPMEIRNFRKNVRTAEKEARKTATQRTLRSSPLASRKDLTKFFDAMVAD